MVFCSFHIIVINLQETILPSVSISSLNDKYCVLGNWFFDAHTKRGISFDGMMPHACKFPLGRQEKTKKKDFTIELIQPIQKMLDFLSSEESIKNGYHLSDILTKTCFVYGKEFIYHQFFDGIKAKIFSIDENQLFKDNLEKVLIEDLENFATKIALTEIKFEEFNVKKVVYRTTTLFISAWARLLGIHESSCFDIVSALADENHITENTKHKLMYSVAVACEVRLRVYFEKKRQEDIYMYIQHHKEQNNSFVNIVGEASLISYFQIAYTLQVAVCKQFGMKYFRFNINPQTLNINICNSLRLNHLARALLKMSRPFAFEDQTFCNFDEFLKNLEEGFCKNWTLERHHSQSKEKTEFVKYFKQSVELNYRKSIWSYQMETYSSAFRLLEKILSFTQNNRSGFNSLDASYNELAGLCKFQMKHYDRAQVYFNRALIILQQISVDESTDCAIADAKYNIGICLIRTKKTTKAKQHLYDALSIYQKFIDQESTFDNFYNIGNCFLSLKKYSLSLIYFKNARDVFYKKNINVKNFFEELAEIAYLLLICLNQKQKAINISCVSEIQSKLETVWFMISLKNVDSKISFTLWKVGKCLLNLKLNKFALFWLKNSLKIYLYHSLKNDLFFAKVVRDIGICYLNINQYYDSLFYFYDALAAFESIFSKTLHNKHVADLYFAIAHSFFDMGHYNDSAFYLEKSITIYKSISVNRNHEEILAYLYNSIGISLIETRDYDKALQNLEISLQIKQKISLDKDYDRDVAMTITNIGKCLIKMGRYSEALKNLDESFKIQQKTRLTLNDDFDIAITLNSIGLYYMEIFNDSSAILYFEKSYNICFSLSSKNDKNIQQLTADVLNNIGLVKMNIGKCDDALSLFEIALNQYKDISPNDNFDRDIAVVLNNIGLCYMNMKLYSDASNNLQKSKRIFCKTSENIAEDDRVAACYNNIGLCLTKLGWSETSLSYFNESLAIYECISCDLNADKDIAGVLCNIGNAFILQSCYDESFTYLKKALEIQKNVSNDHNTDRELALILNDIGNCKKQFKEWSEAISYFEKSLKILRRISNDEKNDVAILRLLCNYAECVAAFKKEELTPENIYWETSMLYIEYNLD